MIKVLHKLKKNRGFTLMELIIVIAVIGILAAMILPSLDTHKAAIDDAVSASRDMYNALQSIFTTYSLTEAPIDISLKDDTKAVTEYVCFYKKVGGNYLLDPSSVSIPDMPPSASLFIEVNASGGVIHWIRFGTTLAELVGLSSTPTDKGVVTARVLQRDLESRLELHDGYYYAEVRYEAVTPDGVSTMTDKVNPIKVKFAAYSKNQIKDCSTSSIKFKSRCSTYGGQVLGVFAPDYYDADNNYLGRMGDKDSVLGNDNPKDGTLPSTPSPAT